jgi:hypothetical protein
MARSGGRPPVGGGGPSNEGPDLTRQEAAGGGSIASLLEGLRLVAHGAQLPFLAYLLNVALEEANNEKSSRG